MEIDDYLNLHLNLAELGLLELRAQRHNLLDLVQQAMAIQSPIALDTYKVIRHQDLILKYGEYTETIAFNPLIHEAFVGWFGTNQLQSKHFSPVLGFQRGPALSGHPDAQGYCVAYKYIRGETLHRYLKTASPAQIKLILKQLGHALHHAWTALDFTHYDLHLRNIIVTEDAGEPIPVLIDYGVAHIRYGTLEYGCRIRSAHIYNRSMWFYDWFKILMSLYGQLVIDRSERTAPKIKQAQIKIDQIQNDQIESESVLDLIEIARLEFYQNRVTHLKQRVRPLASTKLEPVIVELLQFFGGKPMTPTDYLVHQARYQYLEPSVPMLTQTYVFDSFLTLLTAQMTE